MARGTERAEGDRAQAGGRDASALGVADAEPGGFGVLGVVEPVSADVVGREHIAGDQRAAEPQDARRQQLLLDLGGGARGLEAADGVDVVGVLVGERDRRGGFGGEIAQGVVGGGTDRDQYAARAPAQEQWRDDRGRQQLVDEGPERGDTFARNLGTDGQWDRKLRRERGRAGEALHRRAFEVDEIDGG